MEIPHLNAFDLLVEEEGYNPDVLVFLIYTSPLTTAAYIDLTVGKILSQNGDSAPIETPFHYFVWSKNEKGEVVGA